MPNADDELVINRFDIPTGWEPLAECGIDRGEAIRLCRRIRESGRDSAVVVIDSIYYQVWEVADRSWPMDTMKKYLP